MAWRRSVLFAVMDETGGFTFNYSPRPRVDAAWYGERGFTRLIPLYPSLPPTWAEEACRRFRRIQQSRFARSSARPRLALTSMAKQVRRSLRRAGHLWTAHVLDEIALDVPGFGDLSPRSRPPDRFLSNFEYDTEPRWPSGEELGLVHALVEGRLLDELDIVQRVEQTGEPLEHSVEECLTALTLLGKVERRPGLFRTAFGEWRCVRCGETENIVVVDCAACGESMCPACDECRGLGLLTGCTLVYAGRVEKGPGQRVSYVSHELTRAQGEAAAALAQFVSGAGGGDGAEEALVWAVCGAGKTELCFPAVARVLERGGRVLFAIPRRDIVRELGQRLRRAFPKVDVEVLHGGEGRIERRGMPPGTLTVATTHQVLRFDKAFDFIIVDEVDAFPYRTSPMLKRAVGWALREGGRIAHMSATPDRSMVRQADKNRLRLITVPARHHGHPLPVPRLHRVRGLVRSVISPWKGLDEGATEPDHPSRPPLSSRGKAFLRSLIDRSLQAEGRSRVIVFVPDVASTEQVGRTLAQMYRDTARVLWSHARDPERDRKLAGLQRGEGDVFVATTILERGVTVPDVDVIVLFADEERVFSEATLVQMAGRVGRSTERPTGAVHFVGARISGEMRRAVRHIERLNDEAARRGLLHSDGLTD